MKHSRNLVLCAKATHAADVDIILEERKIMGRNLVYECETRLQRKTNILYSISIHSSM